MVAIAADQVGSIRALAESALESAKECSSSEMHWYFAARAAELRDAAQTAPGEASPARAVAEEAVNAARPIRAFGKDYRNPPSP